MMMMPKYRQCFITVGLCLNQDKCTVIVLRPKAQTRQIMKNGQLEVKKVKKLGLLLDSRYQFIDRQELETFDQISCCVPSPVLFRNLSLNTKDQEEYSEDTKYSKQICTMSEQVCKL